MRLPRGSTSLKEEYGAETVATAGGTQRANDWARRRFMNLFGSPNGFHNAHLCWIPTFMIETAIYGWCPFEIDLANSRLIVLWGHNPGASGMPEMRGIFDLKQNGLKVIVIDPRYTETASKADLWLPLRPGSDVALALAWLNVIIWEGLYDQTFIENCCIGFEELAEHVRQYTPEWAAPLTWLDPELIRKGARMYAGNRPGNIQWGVSIDQSGRSAGAGIHARALLRAVTGNLDAPGSDLLCGPSPDFITDEEMEANDWLPEEQKAKQIGSDRYKLITWPGYGRIAAITKEVWGKAPTAEWMCEAHPPSVFRAILTEKPYPVKALIVLGTNPINSYGRTDLVLEALRKVDFLVTMEYWMTPTAMLSDYVLPAASPLERPTITTTYGCSDTLIASERAIQPMFERRTDYEFWRGLGLRMGQEEMWPWDNLEEAFYYRIYPLGYDDVSSYDEFVEKHRFHFPEREYYKYGRVGFATPSGRIELVSSTLAGARLSRHADVRGACGERNRRSGARPEVPPRAHLRKRLYALPPLRALPDQGTALSQARALRGHQPGNGKRARHLHGRLGMDRDEKGTDQAEGEPYAGSPSKGGRDAARLVVSGARGRRARAWGLHGIERERADGRVG